MISIFSLKNLKKFKKPVVALGVFDGVHRGHREILKSVVKRARVIGGTSVVLTFSPHPQKEESLCSLEHRLRLISELGVDAAIVMNFNKKFASILPESFIKNILVKLIGADEIYIGRNFRFGKNASGDYRMLKESGKIYNYKLKAFSIIKINNKPINSTSIRALIRKGDFTRAGKFLGRFVSVSGTVIKGRTLGKRLGFPTANIDAHHEVIPPKGVYTVNVILDAKKFMALAMRKAKPLPCRLNGICYIGARPTLNSGSEVHIEAHIFGFNKYIYGDSLEIRFIKKIREERKFPSLSALSEQIKKDIVIAKKIISRH